MTNRDLDEFAIATLAATPVDSYGAGTAIVIRSGAPNAGTVYKLVEVDGRRLPVAKTGCALRKPRRAQDALRAHKPTGTCDRRS